MISAARRQIIGGGGGGAPINKKLRRRRRRADQQKSAAAAAPTNWWRRRGAAGAQLYLGVACSIVGYQCEAREPDRALDINRDSCLQDERYITTYQTFSDTLRILN